MRIGVVILHAPFMVVSTATMSSHIISPSHRILGHLGDNCIQICHLGRYIVGYTVGKFVLRRRVSGAKIMISERISDDIHPKMTYWNMVIPILMYFLTFTHQNQVFASKTLAA